MYEHKLSNYQMKLLNIMQEKKQNVEALGSFYKYLDIEGGKKALRNNSLQFSNPLSFKDIKECRSLRLNINLDDLLVRIKFISKLIIKDGSDIVKYSKGISRNNHDIDKFIDDIFINRFGICCLSTLPENQYLWNYENIKHNGICLEYDAISLRKFLRNKLKINNSFYFFSPAIYLDVIEKVDYDLDEHILTTILNWFFVKKVDPYTNEHEVRIVSNFDHSLYRKSSLVSLPNKILKNVYVGNEVNDDDYQILQCIIDNNYGNSVSLIRS